MHAVSFLTAIRMGSQQQAAKASAGPTSATAAADVDGGGGAAGGGLAAAAEPSYMATTTASRTAVRRSFSRTITNVAHLSDALRRQGHLALAPGADATGAHPASGAGPLSNRGMADAPLHPQPVPPSVARLLASSRAANPIAQGDTTAASGHGAGATEPAAAASYRGGGGMPVLTTPDHIEQFTSRRQPSQQSSFLANLAAKLFKGKGRAEPPRAASALGQAPGAGEAGRGSDGLPPRAATSLGLYGPGRQAAGGGEGVAMLGSGPALAPLPAMPSLPLGWQPLQSPGPAASLPGSVSTAAPVAAAGAGMGYVGSTGSSGGGGLGRQLGQALSYSRAVRAAGTGQAPAASPAAGTSASAPTSRFGSLQQGASPVFQAVPELNAAASRAGGWTAGGRDASTGQDDGGSGGSLYDSDDGSGSDDSADVLSVIQRLPTAIPAHLQLGGSAAGPSGETTVKRFSRLATTFAVPAGFGQLPSAMAIVKGRWQADGEGGEQGAGPPAAAQSSLGHHAGRSYTHVKLLGMGGRADVGLGLDLDLDLDDEVRQLMMGGGQGGDAMASRVGAGAREGARLPDPTLPPGLVG